MKRSIKATIVDSKNITGTRWNWNQMYRRNQIILNLIWNSWFYIKKAYLNKGGTKEDLEPLQDHIKAGTEMFSTN